MSDSSSKNLIKSIISSSGELTDGHVVSLPGASVGAVTSAVKKIVNVVVNDKNMTISAEEKTKKEEKVMKATVTPFITFEDGETEAAEWVAKAVGVDSGDEFVTKRVEVMVLLSTLEAKKKARAGVVTKMAKGESKNEITAKKDEIKAAKKERAKANKGDDSKSEKKVAKLDKKLAALTAELTEMYSENDEYSTLTEEIDALRDQHRSLVEDLLDETLGQKISAHHAVGLHISPKDIEKLLSKEVGLANSTLTKVPNGGVMFTSTKDEILFQCQYLAILIEFYLRTALADTISEAIVAANAADNGTEKKSAHAKLEVSAIHSAFGEHGVTIYPVVKSNEHTTISLGELTSLLDKYMDEGESADMATPVAIPTSLHTLLTSLLAGPSSGESSGAKSGSDSDSESE